MTDMLMDSRCLMRSSLIAGIVIACSTAWADPAFNKPKDDHALQHLVEGNKHYKVQEFEEALAEYKAGALVESAPLFDYNIGQCFRMLGRYKEAIWQYERFLLYGHPTDQEIVDHVNEWLKLMHDELDRKAMTLKPTEPAPPTTIIVEPDEPWYRDTLGWGLAGAGAVATGVAAYLLWDASSLSDQANNEPNQTMRHDLQNRSSTRNTVGIVVGIGGVGLLATGIVKLVVHPEDRTTYPTTASSWSLGWTGNGVAAFGRF